MIGVLLLTACDASDDRHDGGTGGSQADTGHAGSTASAGAGSAIALGDPLSAPDDTWTWFDFDDSTCRDGSHAGVSVNLHASSKKVLIYLEGGGACFDASTCAQNPADIAGQKASSAGIFDRTNPDNPIADWN
ncbi:MAG TPA: hypothetical protein VGI70_18595, partial [Polyangiales bacterium]